MRIVDLTVSACMCGWVPLLFNTHTHTHAHVIWSLWDERNATSSILALNHTGSTRSFSAEHSDKIKEEIPNCDFIIIFRIILLLLFFFFPLIKCSVARDGILITFARTPACISFWHCDIVHTHTQRGFWSSEHCKRFFIHTYRPACDSNQIPQLNKYETFPLHHHTSTRKK